MINASDGITVANTISALLKRFPLSLPLVETGRVSDSAAEVDEAVEAVLVVVARLGSLTLVGAGNVSDLLAEVEEASEALLAIVVVLCSRLM